MNGNILDFVGAFFAGVLVSLTPCVYPLVPVTAAAIAGANVSGTRWSGFLLSLVYVLGMALAYAGLAVFAATTGKVFGVLQNTPWFLFGVANIFILFALVLFDVIHLPTTKLFNPVRPTNIGGVFLMGAASGFVVGPCTAPALGALLVRAGTQQNVVYAASLLFVFAYGVGAVLILSGTLSGMLSSWPRSGAWMGFVKKFCGIVLLVFAEYYLWRAGSLY